MRRARHRVANIAHLVDGHLLFALRVSHPHIVITVDRRGVAPRVDLRDADRRSARVEPSDSGSISIDGDGQDLWGMLRSGHQLWRERGRPEQWDFGMTVTRHAQTVWAGSQDNGQYTG
ncbi:hypothetical protein ABZ502_32690 [Streptomyces abikoensis]|uniref:hypothetical protein n=1 Tax=Streptomyces abikoensis TaxID=97398 RepID=UPI0033D79261